LLQRRRLLLHHRRAESREFILTPRQQQIPEHRVKLIRLQPLAQQH
jgi:hypothetical protein